MNKLILTILCSVSALLSLAQTELKGRITGENGIPIAYVTISAGTDPHYTFSNESGDFDISVASLPVRLKISAVGYRSIDTLISTPAYLNIRMVFRNYMLSEVVIDGNELNRIFEKSLKNVYSKRNLTFNGKIFCRLMTWYDNRCSEMLEGFYDFIASGNRFRCFSLNNGRCAITSDRKREGYLRSTDFTAFIKLFNLDGDYDAGFMLPGLPYQLGCTGKLCFEFSNEGYTDHAGTKLKIVGYTPKHPELLFNGKLFIDPQNGNLHRLEAFYKGDSMNTLHVQTNHNEKISGFTLTYHLDFSQNSNSGMQFHRFSVDVSYDLTSEKKISHVKTRVEGFVYSASGYAKSPAPHRCPEDPVSDYIAISSRLYIPEFWKDNRVVLQTPLQQTVSNSFEAQGLFGPDYKSPSDSFVLTQIDLTQLPAKTAFLLPLISNTAAPSDRIPYCISLKLNGKTEGALCGRLFMSHNCYNDSFYVKVIPVINTEGTWASDSLRDNDAFPFIFDFYSRMAEVAALKLKYQVRHLRNPCQAGELTHLLDAANTNLFNDEMEMIPDLWNNNNFHFWEKYIDKEENEWKNKH